MPANQNLNSKISSSRKSKQDLDFEKQYAKLAEKVSQKGGRITESEERKLD